MSRYEITYYTPTKHLCYRYRNRMKKASKRVKAASDKHLGMRINYMLLFSIYGGPGDTDHTEIRYYFDWDIVIDVKHKTVVTMYRNHKRRVPPVHLFGDSRTRKLIYDVMFRPNSKFSKAVMAI